LGIFRKNCGCGEINSGKVITIFSERRGRRGNRRRKREGRGERERGKNFQDFFLCLKRNMRNFIPKLSLSLFLSLFLSFSHSLSLSLSGALLIIFRRKNVVSLDGKAQQTRHYIFYIYTTL
jgi:hypothetical protein